MYSAVKQQADKPACTSGYIKSTDHNRPFCKTNEWIDDNLLFSKSISFISRFAFKRKSNISDGRFPRKIILYSPFQKLRDAVQFLNAVVHLNDGL